MERVSSRKSIFQNQKFNFYQKKFYLKIYLQIRFNDVYKKPYDDFDNYDRLISEEAHNHEERLNSNKLGHDYKDSYKSHNAKNNYQKNAVRKNSDGKDAKPRKNSALPEPVILKKVMFIY